MDRQAEENSLNHAIANHLHGLVKRSNRKTILWGLILLVAACLSYLYAEKQLKDASGVFLLPQVDRKVETQQIIDPQHNFEDAIAKVQSFAGQKLAEKLTFTTTQYKFIDSELANIATPNFVTDFKTNINNTRIPVFLEDHKTIRTIRFTLKEVPLVTNAFTATGKSYQDLSADARNVTIFAQWILEINGSLVIKKPNGAIDKKYNLRFYVEIEDLTGMSRRGSANFSKMTNWEIL